MIESGFNELSSSSTRPQPQPKQMIMLGAMVDSEGMETLTEPLLSSFIQKQGKGLATVYFTDKWAESNIKCPLDKMNIAKKYKCVPFIRLQNSEDPDGGSGKPGKYSHKNIVAGKWDTQLKQYASDLALFGSSVLIEYGTEINGDWFDWSIEGPEPFKKAFRYIAKLMPPNVKMAFHCDATDNPNSPKWYPGDDVVSIVGSSVYGGYGSGKGCVDTLADIYKDFSSISKTRPLGIFEWGAPDSKNIAFNVKDTVNTLAGIPKYDRIVLLQRWCEKIVPGHKEDAIGNGMIDVTPQMLDAYVKGISNPVYTDRYLL